MLLDDFIFNNQPHSSCTPSPLPPPSQPPFLPSSPQAPPSTPTPSIHLLGCPFSQRSRSSAFPLPPTGHPAEGQRLTAIRANQPASNTFPACCSSSSPKIACSSRSSNRPAVVASNLSPLNSPLPMPNGIRRHFGRVQFAAAVSHSSVHFCKSHPCAMGIFCWRPKPKYRERKHKGDDGGRGWGNGICMQTRKHRKLTSCPILGMEWQESFGEKGK